MDTDNFDFKPLTQGLGFDKKAEEAKSVAPAKTATTAVNSNLKKTAAPEISKTESKFPARPTSVSQNIETAASLFDKPLEWNPNLPKTSRSITEMINALPPSIDFFDEEKPQPIKEPKVYKPLGRVEYTPGMPDMLEKINENEIPTTKEKLDVSLDNTLEKAFPKVGFRRPFFHQAVEVQPQYTEVTMSFTSAILDALVVTGLTALLLVGLILITGIDLIAVVLYSRASFGVWVELGSIFLGVYLLYYMCARGFWGSTLGDWAFDMHLGTEEQRMKWYYPYQVLLRMFVIAATGFVFFPILSALTDKDSAAAFSKLRLYVKNY